MINSSIKLGYSYFQKPEYFVKKQVVEWTSSLKKQGASMILLESSFTRAIPEDVFLTAKEYELEPIIHFTSELPLARKFNDISILLDVYARWGVRKVIFGDRPNLRQAWLSTGWQFENLVDHFLDRFIPLANYGVHKGLTPILSPLQPGGDYWDTAFAELAFKGLRQRRLDEVIEKLVLGCYGFTFSKKLTWGSGGPQRWPLSKPYLTPDGQEDQLGFHNYEWIQAIAEQSIGVKLPVIILNAGHPGTIYSQPDSEKTLIDIQTIQSTLSNQNEPESKSSEMEIDQSIEGILFSLPTFAQIVPESLTPKSFLQMFQEKDGKQEAKTNTKKVQKIISHYLLLPSRSSGVADVVLNKVRPIIKKYQPTVGFSLDEAALAQKVSIYPDSLLFSEEKINTLRASGCQVEILPESGIDIATSLQRS